jgi:DNA mismatch endonuclease, patch repair protein
MQRHPFKRTERRLAGRTKPRTDASTSARMSRVRQRDTAPELLVRQALRAEGHSFRTHNRDLPGSPDIANRKRKWAVFVHGCYWHQHKGCRLATTPKTNSQFWLAKFSLNVKRDAAARKSLRKRGILVLTIWQCEAEEPQRLTARISTLQRGLASFRIKISERYVTNT